MTAQPEPLCAGFYWWRQTPADAWRMVQVVDFNVGLGMPPHLAAYDIEKDEWGGHTIALWKARKPLGEWLPIERPSP